MKKQTKCTKCGRWLPESDVDGRGRCQTCVDVRWERQNENDPFAFFPRTCCNCKRQIPQGQATRVPLDPSESSEYMSWSSQGLGGEFLATLSECGWWCAKCNRVYERELKEELERRGGYEY